MAVAYSPTPSYDRETLRWPYQLTDHDHIRTIPRKVAHDLLVDVVLRHQSLDELFGKASFTTLPADDKRFISFLLRTTLRHLGEIDALIDDCLEKPLPKKSRGVRECLRLGVTQLLFSETADHAAVSTTVDLCREIGQVPYAKLVNAIMRRLQREGAAKLAALDGARLNTPAWLFESWVRDYGEDTARRIAAVHLQMAPLDLTPKEGAASWAECLGGEVVLGGTVRLREGGDVTQLAGFDDGHWWVQDAAARLPVLLAGDVAGKTVFDLCAAPGGKTMAFAALGADVTAVDINARRLARIDENLARTGLSATTVTSDIRKWVPGQQADVVLLDAPCSATGTVRRHPDVAHLKSPNDVKKLQAVQEALLAVASNFVKPGGLLIYVTCSLQAEEGPNQIAAFLSRDSRFAREPVQAAEISGLTDAITADGDLRTLPCHLAEIGGLDGFFAARLRLKK